MSMSMAYVCGLCLCPLSMPMSMHLSMSLAYVDGLCLCLWPMSMSMTMSVSMAYVYDYVDVYVYGVCL